MISVVSHDFIDTPGIIANITNPLHENNINIVELSSSQTAVVVFVDWEDGEKAYELIRETLQ
jgi:aspartate kinase